jgi:hypothetical protein
MVTGYQITPYLGTVPQAATTVTASGVRSPPTSAIVNGLSNGSVYTFTVAATNGDGTGPASPPSNPVTPIQGGSYHPLPPSRILDTRDGTGGVPATPLGPKGSLLLRVLGTGGVPASGVSAVVLNVAVTNTTAAGYLTIYPNGAPQPVASSINWTAGKTVPNLVEVAVGLRGFVTIYNAAGSADVIADVQGWVGVATNSMTRDGLYDPIVPNRVLDTRDGTGGVPSMPLGAGKVLSIKITGTPNVPATGVEAVVLNVTVTNPTAGSYLTVFPTGNAVPLASNLNFTSGQTVANRVIVKLGIDPATNTFGWVSFYNAAGSVDVIADVSGWFTDATSAAGGSRFSGIVPARFFDSRDPAAGGPLGPGDVGTLEVTDNNGEPATGITALVINVTVTDPTAGSYLTLWPAGAPKPLASDLNWAPGETVANLVVVELSGASFNLYNAAGWTDVVIDLVGFYGPGVSAPAGAAPLGLRFSRERREPAPAGR